MKKRGGGKRNLARCNATANPFNSQFFLQLISLCECFQSNLIVQNINEISIALKYTCHTHKLPDLKNYFANLDPVEKCANLALAVERDGELSRRHEKPVPAAVTHHKSVTPSPKAKLFQKRNQS